MRRSACKVLFLAICGLFIVSFAGCNETSLSEPRKSRLIADENRQLKKELKSQKEQLAKCLQEKQALKEQREVEMLHILETLTDKNRKLSAENEELRGQIEQLQKEAKKL